MNYFPNQFCFHLPSSVCLPFPLGEGQEGGQIPLSPYIGEISGVAKKVSFKLRIALTSPHSDSYRNPPPEWEGLKTSSLSPPLTPGEGDLGGEAGSKQIVAGGCQKLFSASLKFGCFKSLSLITGVKPSSLQSIFKSGSYK